VSTKHLPDVYSVAELISPLVTSFHTTIVLIQNGLDIEVPLIAAFPTNTIISSVSMIGSSTEGENHLRQIGHDNSIIGPHFHTGLPRETQLANATTFVELYRAGGANEVLLSEDMPMERWRKLIWNGTFNTLCALMRMNVGELQSSGGRETMLVPMMWEVWNMAKADGHQLPDDLVEFQAYRLPDDCPYRPSMLLDVEHGRPMELEVILGNAIKRADALGVQAPKMKAVYELLKMEQWKMNHIKKEKT
jgi:2-dehydropantoate 2-reductase